MQNQDTRQAPKPQVSSRLDEARINARLGPATPPRSFKERLAAIANARVDPANDRLLLYEILLEEFESMDQPQLDPTDQEAIRSAIEEIRLEGEACQSQCAGLPEDKRDAFEEIFNGELTKRVYAVLRQVQAYQTKLKRTRLEKVYAEITPDVNERQARLSRSFAKEIYGEFEVERERLRKELEETVAAENIEHEINKRIIQNFHSAVTVAQTPAEETAAVETAPQTGNGNEPSTKGVAPATAAERIRQLEILDAQTQRSALCLSGGGIRSATFNLGILQGLARYGLLGRFDYLSTVSGGGFVGGWLSAWIQRKGLDKVMEDLKNTPDSPLKPEAKPITHLRDYSNFLSPKLGLLYADTWSLLGTLLRNVTLTWLVFVPFLIAVLMLPRLLLAFIHRPFLNNNKVPGTIASASESLMWWFGFSNAELISLVIGFLAGWLYLSYIGAHLPSTQEEDSREGSFFKWCLLPMVISALAFVIFWLRVKQRGGRLSVRELHLFGWTINLPPWYAFVIFGVMMITVPWIVSIFYRFKSVGRSNFWKFAGASGLASLLIGIAQIINGFLLWYFATQFFHIKGYDYDSRLYIIFAVPIVLAIWALSGVLMAGFTSRFTLDEDLEWWARAGAWIMITMVVWVAVNSLVLYGPDLFDSVTEKLKSPLNQTLNWTDTFKIAAGIFSVAAALYGGFSSRTPANSQQAKKAGLMGKVGSLLTNLFALLAMIFLLILIVLLTDIILASNVGAQINLFLATSHDLSYTITDHKNIIFNSASWYLIAVTIIIGALSVVMGWLINTNRFSLHYMWRDRIIRAYLGASREERNPNLFTGFDTCDNTQMYRLRPDQPRAPKPQSNCPESAPSQRSGKLLHIINIALNLTGSNKLAWQDRKSESFTVSPLHCGSYWLGYRRSWRYGGIDDDSISLGTAVAISGAFVSPNMGYMMTSPVLRFLMALFNVRFGWWLGNPGRAGESDVASKDSLNASLSHTYNLNSPRLSVKPIVQEAFGLINDKSDYIYLSDGGHFENLGLYEMILRRCRFIVVSDASTDADYSFSSLAMSIRQIRVDLGVPIEIKNFPISSQAQDRRGKYGAVGTIRYSCVDGGTPEETDGVLLYLKAALIGGEPRDVLNYSNESGDFPQEVIVDQWFSEAQFESYRALGSHIIRAICGDNEKQITLAELLRKVQEHNRLDYDVFREQISYAAYEHQFKENMKNLAPLPFKEKVREYVEKTLGEDDY
jgi:hypothetical protein